MGRGGEGSAARRLWGAGAPPFPSSSPWPPTGVNPGFLAYSSVPATWGFPTWQHVLSEGQPAGPLERKGHHHGHLHCGSSCFYGSSEPFWPPSPVPRKALTRSPPPPVTWGRHRPGLPSPVSRKALTRRVHRSGYSHILLGGWGCSTCRVFSNSSKAGRRAQNPGFTLQIPSWYLTLKTTGLCWRSGSVDAVGAGHWEQSQGSPGWMFTPGRWGPLTLTPTLPNHSWSLRCSWACGEGPCPAGPPWGGHRCCRHQHGLLPCLHPVPSLPAPESQAPTGASGPGPLPGRLSPIVRAPSAATACTGRPG